MERPEPKPRPIKLEAHILAYLGDFMSVFEESVKRLAQAQLVVKDHNKNWCDVFLKIVSQDALPYIIEYISKSL